MARKLWALPSLAVLIAGDHKNQAQEWVKLDKVAVTVGICEGWVWMGQAELSHRNPGCAQELDRMWTRPG